MTAVEVREVTKTFGKTVAVRDLSLSVPRGSIYGFIGPNGSGKTTTIRMILNILYPDSGEIRVFGKRETRLANDQIGYLPEERGLYRRMKLKEALRFYGRLKTPQNLDGEIDHWLERLDLIEFSNAKVSELSKGMSQKAQFIATIIARPDLLILDEPFSGLDPVNTDLIKDAILELRDAGTTIIFSTHDMNVAEKMCDFICMIFKGSKVLDGTLSSIQKEHATDTLRIRTGGNGEELKGLPGIIKINDFGREQELRIAADTDPQDLLRRIVQITAVESFEIKKPSLHNIFVRIAGPEAREVDDAKGA